MKYCPTKDSFLSIVKSGGQGSIIVSTKDDLGDIIDEVRALLAPLGFNPQITMSPLVARLLRVKAVQDVEAESTTTTG